MTPPHRPLGEVTDILETGANDVYVVRGRDGRRDPDPGHQGRGQRHRSRAGPHADPAAAWLLPAHEPCQQRLYRTPAVILKRMDLGEADRIVTLFSRDVGKVRAVAKGVRRTTSRSAGHLEPFTLSDVLFAVGRELDVVSQADTLDAFRDVREDLDLTTHAYYLAELVDLLTEDRSENRAVFDDPRRRALLDLREDADARLVLIMFHLRLLEALGYRPELRECVTCRATIEPERNHFSALLGGVVCPACGPARAYRARHRHVGA